MIQQISQQLNLAEFSVIIAIFSLIISAFSAFYTMRKFSLEKARHAYDLEEKLLRESPVLQIQDAFNNYWFNFGSPSVTDEHPSYGTLTLQPSYEKKTGISSTLTHQHY